MTTLAESGRISVTDVEDERQRLELNARAWNESNQELELILTPDQLVAIDLFDQIESAANPAHSPMPVADCFRCRVSQRVPPTTPIVYETSSPVSACRGMI
jgi:hypothetical protein